MTKATLAANACRGRVLLPTFASDSKGTDFNNMAVEQGRERSPRRLLTRLLHLPT